MRAPRLSFGEEFRSSWDKENRDPITQEYSPIRRRIICDTPLHEVHIIDNKRILTPPTTTLSWLDDLLK
ncbi:hypothetical protein NEOKW01_0877 [Nematocida sp. AWRm80]|nr:hypothetical protein NEOKW01_0877 [Nematocida sp. AWRm80]